MYCPKCATQNSEQARFCRGCGIDLQVVAQALSGTAGAGQNAMQAQTDAETKRRAEYEKALKNVIVGIGFLIVSAAVYFLVPGGFTWFYAFLFPAFACGASGFVKLKSFKEEQARLASAAHNYLPPRADANLPSRGQPLFSGDATPQDFSQSSVASFLDSQRSSVTEATTRHLANPRTTDRTNDA